MRFVLGVVALFLLHFNVFAQCVVTMRVQNYVPQYYQTGDDRQWSGMAVDHARQLVEHAGCRMEFLTIPWKRTFVLIKNGEVDLITNISKTAERQEYLHYIGPIREEQMVLVVPRESNYPIDSLDNFKLLPKPVGILIGSHYGDEFTNKYNSESNFRELISLSPRTQDNVKKLKFGRTSAFVMDRLDFNYKSQRNDLFKELKLHSFIVNRNNVYFGFSKKSVSDTLLKKLKASYAQLAKQGVFEDIVTRYQQLPDNNHNPQT